MSLCGIGQAERLNLSGMAIVSKSAPKRTHISHTACVSASICNV